MKSILFCFCHSAFQFGPGLMFSFCPWNTNCHLGLYREVSSALKIYLVIPGKITNVQFDSQLKSTTFAFLLALMLKLDISVLKHNVHLFPFNIGIYFGNKQIYPYITMKSSKWNTAKFTKHITMSSLSVFRRLSRCADRQPGAWGD